MSGTKYRDALRKVLISWEISQASLCRKAGKISPSMLSSYLEGSKDIGTDRFCRLLNAIPSGAQADFYALVSPESTSPPAVERSQNVLHIVKCFLAEGRCDGQTFNDLIGVLAMGGGKVQRPASSSSEDSTTGS